MIVYGHTSLEYPEVPKLLERIVDYALNVKELKQKNITDIYNLYELGKGSKIVNSVRQSFDESLRGKEKVFSAYARIKEAIKNFVDYEKVTPIAELRCGYYSKLLKIIFRKILR